MTKLFSLTKHALERLRERNIPRADLERLLQKAVQIEDVISGAKLYVFKSENLHYTLVTSEEDDRIVIITGYEASEWQIQQFEKVKKSGSNKVL